MGGCGVKFKGVALVSTISLSKKNFKSKYIFFNMLFVTNTFVGGPTPFGRDSDFMTFCMFVGGWKKKNQKRGSCSSLAVL